MLIFEFFTNSVSINTSVGLQKLFGEYILVLALHLAIQRNYPLLDRINRIARIFPSFLKKLRKYNIHKERKCRIILSIL